MCYLHVLHSGFKYLPARCPRLLTSDQLSLCQKKFKCQQITSTRVHEFQITGHLVFQKY